MRREDVSVIISTYNYGQFIEDAIKSVLEQTYPKQNIEIIVVDDGSTDDTSERLKKYKENIKYIYKQNGGHASALNAGFKAAKGGIIFFLDADDYWRCDKIGIAIKYYEEYGCSALLHNADIVGQEEESRKTHFEDYHLKYADRLNNNVYLLSLAKIKDFFRFHGTLLSIQSYKRDLCKKMFPIPTAYRKHTDLYLFIYALLHSNILYVHDQLSYYRQHAGSHMASLEKDISELEMSIALHQRLVSSLEKEGDKTRLFNSMINNKLCYDYFKLAKLKKQRVKGFLSLIRYNPGGTLLLRLLRKLDLLLSFLMPTSAYNGLRIFYNNCGLRALRKGILQDRFGQ